MDQFFHVRMLIGIILGLAITQLLKGIAKFIQHPGREKAYPLHLLWVFYTFLLILHFWWWEFDLLIIKQWNFPLYFFVVGYATSYYLTASLLFPEDLKDYSGYRSYFFSRKKWFFSVVAGTYMLDVLDSLIKHASIIDHMGIVYYTSVAVHVALCFLAGKIKNARFQYTVAILFIVYQLIFIYTKYYFLNSK